MHAEELATNLKSKDFNVGLLHGDMFQTERNEIIHKFRKENMPVLVATDVAGVGNKINFLTDFLDIKIFFWNFLARGLDIPAIKTVVNYDVARDIDTHVHRIGRTGRAGIF